MIIPSYPKIFTIGTKYISDIFKEEVEITEKLDGSHFKFGIIDGVLYFASKNAELYTSNPSKNFAAGIKYIDDLPFRLPSEIVFYGEYFKGPRQNTLKYERIPKNHIILFAAMDITTHKFMPYSYLQEYGTIMGLECAPLLYKGFIKHPDELDQFLTKTSILGNIPIEGVVVKNYERPFLLGDRPIPLMAGKWVSSSFQEVNKKNWDKTKNKDNRLQVFFDSYCTIPRWEKAVQHLRDEDKLLFEAKDIGSLIKEINRDIEEEEKEEVKNFLWKEFKGQLLRQSTKGFPQWYKTQLMEGENQ